MPDKNLPEPPNPSGLCMCGCGSKTPLSGITCKRDQTVAGEHVRFLRGHHSRRPLAERFWEKVAKAGPDECWEWQAARYPAGYGCIGVPGGGMRGAHRVAYELTHGPIPRGEGYHGTCVLHRCDNPPCVNPAHLFLGTNSDNAIDMTQKGHQHKAKLLAGQIPVIRRLGAEGYLHREIAERFGVSRETISQVLRGEHWGHVKE